jgi:TonB family protein
MVTCKQVRQILAGWVFAFASFAGANTSPTPPPPDYMNAINAAISAATPRMLACYPYAEIRKRAHQPEESLVVRFHLNSTGKVTWAKVRKSEINHPEVEACIVAEVKNLQIPALPEGSEMSFNFPLHWQFTGAALRDPNPPKPKHVAKSKAKQKKVAQGKKKAKAPAKTAQKKSKTQKLGKAKQSKKTAAVKSKKKPPPKNAKTSKAQKRKPASPAKKKKK